jgi:hypothetical protein
MPIILSPSDSTEALVDAINSAVSSTEDGILYLKPGTHFTRKYFDEPSETNIISVGDKVLRIRTKPWWVFPWAFGATKATIKRPNDAINPARPDNNYGLFFKPSIPEPDGVEISQITEWKKGYTDKFGVFDYAILLRGEIHISNVDIDCNMANQGLDEIYANLPPGANPPEHSCMIGFSGLKHLLPVVANQVPRIVFVAFKKVTVNNVVINNGGFADDILISRGYFNPNIVSVEMNNITAKRENRYNAKRSTITFSGLAKNFKASNLDIYSLQAEPDSKRWRDLPGSVTGENYCNWQLSHIKAEILDITSPRKSLYLNARNLTITKSCPLSEIAGSISNSTLTKNFKSPNLTRLDHFIFRRVNWIILQDDREEADPNKMIKGIIIDVRFGDSCEIEFKQNKFILDGELINPVGDGKYFLISSEYSVCRSMEYDEVENVCGRSLEEIKTCLNTEKLSLGDYKNSCLNKVDIRFNNCEFDSRFGSEDFTNTWIARPFERGKWYFSDSDFGLRPRDRALYETNIKYDVLVTVT